MRILTVALLIFAVGCQKYVAPVSASGAKQTSTKIKLQADGRSVEQDNIVKRLQIDNSPGALKHLYIVSAYSGQTLIYSTVKGKVTSSGKRLTPTTGEYTGRTDKESSNEIRGVVDIGGSLYRTDEIIQDDGTYGSSIEYLYWFDQRDVYHQHYLGGGQIVHISNEPLSVKDIIINMEVVK